MRGALRLTLKEVLYLTVPRSFSASLGPAIFGLLLCRLYGLPLRLPMYFMLPAAVLFLHGSVNTLNDYFDYVKGTDSKNDMLEERDAVLLYGSIQPKTARDFGLLWLALGLLFGAASCFMIREPLCPLLIGAIGAAVVVLYSGGPLPLSYLPIGEVVSGLTMGLLIPLGIAACADGKLHPEITVLCLPLILGIGMVMLCNNGCDIEKDTKAHRKTLPIVLGRERAVTLYHAWLLLWLLSLIVLPLKVTGIFGLIPIAALCYQRRVWSTLWSLRLRPEDRITQMKSISSAVLGAFVSYCLAFLLFVLFRNAY